MEEAYKAVNALDGVLAVLEDLQEECADDRLSCCTAALKWAVSVLENAPENETLSD